MANSLFSPVGFGLAIICFLFTFCEIDCSGDPIMKVSGIDLAFGTDPKPMGILANETFDMADADEIMGDESSGEVNIYALIAFLAILGGLLFFFLLPAKFYSLIAAIAGIGAFVCLLILQFTITSDLDEEARKLVDINFKLPYWIAMISSLFTGLINFMRWRQ